MKLWIMSDLHLEFAHHGYPGHVFEPKVIPVCDAVILSGDIATGTGACKWIEETFPKELPVVYIAGNHEGYRHDLYEVHTRLGQWAEQTPNVRYLNNEWTVLGNDTWVFGGTLWTDFALDGDPDTAKRIAELSMNDYIQIRYRGARLTPDMTTAWHKDALRQITEVAGFKPVYVTHHLPSRRSVDPDYRSSEANPAYASNLDYLMVGDSAPVLWVHGHTHRSKDYVQGNTRVVCNPRGYPIGDGKNWSFNPGLVVEI